MIIVYIVIGIFIGWFTKIPIFYNSIKNKLNLLYEDLDVLFNTIIQNIPAKTTIREKYKKRYEEIKKRYKRL